VLWRNIAWSALMGALGCPGSQPQGSFKAPPTSSADSAPKSQRSPNAGPETQTSQGAAMLTEMDQAIINEANEAIAHALSVVDNAAPKECSGLARETLPREIPDWHARIFRTPPDLAKVPCALHLSADKTDDVVRFQWQHGDFDIVEYQTPTVLSVWIRLKREGTQPKNMAPSEVTTIARSLFNISADFLPRPPSSKEQVVALSTAPTESIYGMPAWSNRIDAGAHGDSLHFLFYKRHPQLIGLGTGGHWFDDEFRRRNR
jgi:hypothetical protein